MKTLTLFLFSGLTLGLSAAQADVTIQLADINTNDCNRAQSQISLLNSQQVAVTAVCSDYLYQGYPASNGRIYNYKMFTTITILGAVAPGQTFRFANIDTNNCRYAQDEVLLLNSSQATLSAQCSPFSQGGYTADDGRVYNFQLYSTITVN